MPIDWHPISEIPDALKEASVLVWMESFDKTMGSNAGMARMHKGKPVYINGQFAFDMPTVTHYAEIEPPEAT